MSPYVECKNTVSIYLHEFVYDLLKILGSTKLVVSRYSGEVTRYTNSCNQKHPDSGFLILSVG